MFGRCPPEADRLIAIWLYAKIAPVVTTLLTSAPDLRMLSYPTLKLEPLMTGNHTHIANKADDR